MTHLKLEQISKEYGLDTPAVANVSLEVASGELFVLLGPSGGGKSTILRLIAGLLNPSKGDICFDGKSILQTAPHARGAVMMFQADALFPFMSVGENVAFGLRARRINRTTIEERVREALSMVQLAGYETRMPDSLSGGQRQRVALARALVVKPRMLLLDEPLSNLDRQLRSEVRAMIKQVQRQTQITTLFVTHDQEEAVAIADRIGLIFNGQLRQVGTPRDFYDKPADSPTSRFFGNYNQISAHKEGKRLSTPLGKLEIEACDLPDGPVLATIRPESIAASPSTQRHSNRVSGVVEAIQYRGPFTLCRVMCGEIILEVQIDAHRPVAKGDTLIFRLPPKRIWLMPPESKERS